MRLIELHILQSFPVTCLNRDDVGAPKSAIFGGVQRARVSSQCWKRAIREIAKEYEPALFAGQRTRYLIQPLKDAFVDKGQETEAAAILAEALADELGKLDSVEKGNVKTLLFFSPCEISKVAESMLQQQQQYQSIIEATLRHKEDIKKLGSTQDKDKDQIKKHTEAIEKQRDNLKKIRSKGC